MNAKIAKQHRRLDAAIRKIFPPIKASPTDVAWHLITYLAIVLGRDGREQGHWMLDAIFNDLEATDVGNEAGRLDRPADISGVEGDSRTPGQADSGASD